MPYSEVARSPRRKSTSNVSSSTTNGLPSDYKDSFRHMESHHGKLDPARQGFAFQNRQARDRNRLRLRDRQCWAWGPALAGGGGHGRGGGHDGGGDRGDTRSRGTRSGAVTTGTNMCRRLTMRLTTMRHRTTIMRLAPNYYEEPPPPRQKAGTSSSRSGVSGSSWNRASVMKVMRGRLLLS